MINSRAHFPPEGCVCNAPAAVRNEDCDSPLDWMAAAIHHIPCNAGALAFRNLGLHATSAVPMRVLGR